MTRTINLAAAAAARAAVEHLDIEPADRVEYRSQGLVAVIGGPEAMEFAPRLCEPLRPRVVLTNGAEEPGVPVIPVGGRSLRIDGYMGAFKIRLGEAGSPASETLPVDLILDLTPVPLLGMPVKPPGYLCSGTDETSLAAALEQLSSLIGTFEKPRFFEYDPSVCAHGRSGQIACNRCIDSCPAEAIVGLAERVEVDPYLCQGGGVCASVCPTGAIRYTFPRAADTLSRVRIMLRAYLQAGGEQPVIIFVSSQDVGSLAPLPANWLLVAVEELASVGLEVWLSSLAYGACRVLMVDGGSMPDRVGQALELQFETVRAILGGLGYSGDAIALRSVATLTAEEQSVMPPIQPAGYYALADKRQTAYLAIDYLHGQTGRAKAMVNLPAGAPFGSAEVKAAACTLCLACVGVCPGKALQDGYDRPELRFIEANCVQCGLCTRTCPEDAISISPRLLFEPQERTKPRILHQDEPFCCPSCGKPFATRSVISKMLDKLKQHPMFQTERARRRLTLCDDCRVVDIVQDSEAMEAGLEPPSIGH